MLLIDLTQTFGEQMPCFPNDPPSELCCISSVEKTGWTHYRLSSGMHVGTHLDAPLHRFADGRPICDIPIPRLIAPGCLIDARGAQIIGSDAINNRHIKEGDIVIFLTGMSARFREPDYFTAHPVLSEELAYELVQHKVSAIGIDAPSPDRTPFAIHDILLGAGVLIIENLTNLESLLDMPEFQLIALPPKFHTEAAPVRVVAVI